MSLRESIATELIALYEEDELDVPELDDLVLLETELDSSRFAVLVTRLDETLGFDPFTEMDEPVYPSTFGEFVEIYERHAQEGQVAMTVQVELGRTPHLASFSENSFITYADLEKKSLTLRAEVAGDEVFLKTDAAADVIAASALKICRRSSLNGGS